MFSKGSNPKRKTAGNSIFSNSSSSSLFRDDDNTSSSQQSIYKKRKKSKNYFKKTAIALKSSPGTSPVKSKKYNSYGLNSKSDDSDDDFEVGIINISTLRDESVSAKDVKSENSSLKELSEDEGQPAAEVSKYEGFALKVANGNILDELSKENKAKIKDVKKEFRKYNFPKPISSKSKLLKKADKHMHIIPKILKGKETTSHFYELAKKQRQASPHETMAMAEKWDISWKDYYGGYYGFKRQSILGDVISSKFEKELKSTEKKNKTLSYWTINGFSTYVLANEVIIRMAMEDLDLSFDKAEAMIKKSVEYGSLVADSIDIKDDISHTSEEAKEFMKEFSPEAQESPRVTYPSKSARDILEVVLDDK